MPIIREPLTNFSSPLGGCGGNNYPFNLKKQNENSLFALFQRVTIKCQG